MGRKFLAAMMLAFVIIVSACSAGSGGNAAGSNLAVHGDLVSHGACVLQSRYMPGESIVFRVDVKDTVTGKQAEDAEVKVHLSNGETLDMVYGSHGETAKFWTVSYSITEDTELGTLNYYVTAKTSNKSGEFYPFDVEPSLLTIVAKDET